VLFNSFRHVEGHTDPLFSAPGSNFIANLLALGDFLSPTYFGLDILFEWFNDS
jgi:hypothetical protein